MSWLNNLWKKTSKLKWINPKTLALYTMISASAFTNLACFSPKTKEEEKLEQLKKQAEDLEDQADVLEDQAEAQEDIAEARQRINDAKSWKKTPWFWSKTIWWVKNMVANWRLEIIDGDSVSVAQDIQNKYANGYVSQIKWNIYRDDSNIYMFRWWNTSWEANYDVYRSMHWCKPIITHNGIAIKTQWISAVIDDDQDTWIVINKSTWIVQTITWNQAKATRIMSRFK